MRTLALLLFFISPVSFAGSTTAIQPGRKLITTVRNAYASTNVTTSAWVELVSSMPVTTSVMEIFDSSGQTLKIGFGASGSEITQLYVFPGGNGTIPVEVPVDTRVSIRAVTGTASSGELDINFYK